MKEFFIFLFCYLIFISLLSVICCVCDKRFAKKGKRRISEKTLFILSALGGSVAMYITMLKSRHKTKHKRFMIGLPLIIALQVVLTIFLLTKL